MLSLNFTVTEGSENQLKYEIKIRLKCFKIKQH